MRYVLSLYTGEPTCERYVRELPSRVAIMVEAASFYGPSQRRRGMTEPLYAAFSTITPRQRDCLLVLRFGDSKVSLSYDDSIEFKLEIGYIEENRKVTQRAVQSFNEPWTANFAAIHTGFSIHFKEPSRSMGRLSLKGDEALQFSERLQSFITEAGQQS